MFCSQSQEIFEEWKLRLFNRRPFRTNDRICERHFTKDQILTHWDHVIDGKLVQLEREKPRLKDNAIPLLNLEVRDAHAKRTRVIVPKEQKVTRIKQQLLVAETTDATDDGTDASNDVDLDNHLDMATSDEEVVDVRIEKLNETGEDAAETQDENAKQKMFDTIYDDIYEVVLPSTLWGIHRDPEQKFIAFTQFDAAKMNCNKSLYVSSTFEMHATICGTNVSHEMADALSVELLSKALSELDEQQNGEAEDMAEVGIESTKMD